MNQGAEILLKRMDSHPEEFTEHTWDGEPTLRTPGDKWSGIINELRTRAEMIERPEGFSHWRKPLPFLSDEEVRLLYDKWASLQSKSFTEHVMRKILEDPPVNEFKWKTVKLGPVTLVDRGNPAPQPEQNIEELGETQT